MQSTCGRTHLPHRNVYLRFKLPIPIKIVVYYYTLSYWCLHMSSREGILPIDDIVHITRCIFISSLMNWIEHNTYKNCHIFNNLLNRGGKKHNLKHHLNVTYAIVSKVQHTGLTAPLSHSHLHFSKTFEGKRVLLISRQVIEYRKRTYTNSERDIRLQSYFSVLLPIMWLNETRADHRTSYKEALLKGTLLPWRFTKLNNEQARYLIKLLTEQK